MTSLREVGEAVGDAVLDGVGRVSARVQERRPLAADLLESDDAYLVVFDAPGATEADVEVRFENGAVRVRVDRFREFHEGFEMRVPGRGLSLDGEVDLPAGASVDPEAASATLTDAGTLEVRVPKTDPGDDGPVDISTEVTDHDADHESDGAAGGDVDAGEETTDDETAGNGKTADDSGEGGAT
ncbi:MAG: Hsp20/alpha crystallin family protein [Haloarculaceae archaeon]